MDNGHRNAIFSSPEVDDNLNMDTWQKSLEISAPVGMPSPEQISEAAVSSPEIPVNFPEAPVNSLETPAVTPETLATAPETPTATLETLTTTPEAQPSPLENTPALGQIVPLSTPINPNASEIKPYNSANIKTEGDYLDKKSLAEIEKLEAKLSQDGDLNSFYDHTRDLTEVNLNNSFNRQLYQNPGGAK